MSGIGEEMKSMQIEEDFLEEQDEINFEQLEFII
jgi:hypothetical protein